MANNKTENAHSAINKFIENYEFYEEGSLLDAYIQQINKEGLSSIFMPNQKIHHLLRSLGFFSPLGKTNFIYNREPYKAPGLSGQQKIY
tara:strand:- start:906 stop:1172 length:267 start_codon:yes stop_codon:yes gene_type:complete